MGHKLLRFFVNSTRYKFVFLLSLFLVACNPSDKTLSTNFVSSQFRDTKFVDFQNLKSKNGIVCGEVTFADKSNPHRAFNRFVVKKMSSGLSGTVENFGSFGVFEGFKMEELILKEAAMKYIYELGRQFDHRREKVKSPYIPHFEPDVRLKRIFSKHEQIFDFYRTHNIGFGVELKFAGNKFGGPIAFEEAFSTTCSF